jgi:hypothetical protein
MGHPCCKALSVGSMAYRYKMAGLSQAPVIQALDETLTDDGRLQPVDFTGKLPPEVLDLVAQSAADHRVLGTFAVLNHVTHQVARSWAARSLAESLHSSMRAVSAANSAEMQLLAANTQSSSAAAHRRAFAALHAAARALRTPIPLGRPQGQGCPSDWASLNEACRVVRLSLCRSAAVADAVIPEAEAALKSIARELMVPCAQWEHAQTHAAGGRNPGRWFWATVETGPILGRFDIAGQFLRQLPPVLWYTQSLTTMVLDSNLFTEVPQAIAHMPNLVHLSMGNNRLVELPDWMAHCQKLTTLQLGDNLIAAMPAVVWQLPRLRSLGLENNHFLHIALPATVHPALEELRLDLNGLESLPEGMPERLPRLRTLGLAESSITVLPQDFTQWQRHMVLDLSGLGLQIPQALQQCVNRGQMSVLQRELETDSDDGLSEGPPEGFEDLDFESSDHDLM